MICFTVPNSILLQPGGQVPVFISPRNRVARLYPQALGSLFVASYVSQGYSGSIPTRLHTGFNCYSFWVSCYITSGRTYRENTFPSHIQENICLLLSDGLFPRIYLHGNICLSLVPLIHGNVFAVTGWFPRIHLHGNVFADSFPSNGSARHSII
jgi:hypothetical protein